MGFGDFIKDVAGGLVSSIPVVGPSASNALGLSSTPSIDLSGMISNVGGDWMKNQLIGVPNANNAFSQSREAALEAYDRSVDSYKHRYQWTMEDMKKAGLNPILAAGSGGFNVSGIPSMSNANSFNPPSPYGSFASSARDTAQADLFKQKEKESLESVALMRAKKGLVSAQEKQALQVLVNAREEVKRIGADIGRLKSQTSLNEKQKNRLSAEIKRIQAETEKAMAAAEQLKAIAKVYKTPLGQVLAWFKEFLGSFGIGGILLPVGRRDGSQIDSFTEYGKDWKSTRTVKRRKR